MAGVLPTKSANVKRAARAVGQLPPRQPQIALELGDAGEQRFQAFEMIIEHESNRADHRPVLVLDRHAGDDELLAAERHDVEQDRLAGLGHLPHQAVRDDLLDRAADRLAGMVETERGKVFLVDVDDTSAAIDRNGTFAELFQPREQRLHRARTEIDGIADRGGRRRHEIPRGGPPVY
ncbi:hypothetical protein ABIA41_001767 [Bradyrhizobium sp. USDA 313]